MKRWTLTLSLLCCLTHSLHAQQVQEKGLAPEEALKRMKVAPGFDLSLVAAEPAVRQPVSISFDDRGRIWVVQYLQFPSPAGLKPVKIDQYLRTKYDRVPEPPPHGPRGADIIAVLEDPDGTGRFRKSKNVLTGLNLASGMALGHGGIFVAQPPYLLFYPDRDGNDVPDGDPEVLLTGFGMDDAHAFANSLQWGPDGWLYGATGSTSYTNIRGIEFVQGIWRYHPRTKEFELFSEGGGNTYGLDFDRQGNAIAGTNFGNVAMLHQVQGAYYVKGFAKHGPLKNPHAYGYFEHVPYTGFKGGHVTCGGVVYQSGVWPEQYRHQYIAANLLSNAIYWHKLVKDGSTYKASFGGPLVETNDQWFRPIDCLTGPDGAVYITDWYDRRATHLDPRDNWHRDSGRIYRLQPKNVPSFDWSELAKQPLRKRSSQELILLLKDASDWHRREARLILAERRDPAVIPALQQWVEDANSDLAQEALWALHVSGGCDEDFVRKLLQHPREEIRTWAIRLVGDTKQIKSPGFAAELAALAAREKSPLVMSQLTCSVRRWPSKDAMPIIKQLLLRKDFLADQHIPMLSWWAVESHAVTGTEQLVALFRDDKSLWQAPLVQRIITERLGRRFMAEGKELTHDGLAALLSAAPDRAAKMLLVKGIDAALAGKQAAKVTDKLMRAVSELSDSSQDLTVLSVLARMGNSATLTSALTVVQHPTTPETTKLRLLDLLAQAPQPSAIEPLLHVFADGKSEAIRQATLRALQSYDDPRIAQATLPLYAKLSPALKTQVRTLLISRPKSALALLKEVEAKHISDKELTLQQAQQIAAFGDKQAIQIIEKHWGRTGKATTGEKQAKIGYYRLVLNRHGLGDPGKGHALYTKHCATCHTLHGQGNKVGPDLTTANRKDREYLLLNIVDPSAVQRLDYANSIVSTKDGRVLTGVIVDGNPEAITLADVKNERTKLLRGQIEDIAPSPVSLMPEGILDQFTDTDLCDFFAYLQTDAPAKQPAQPAGAKKGGKLLKVCLISGSLEYKSDESLTALQKYLEANYNIECSRAFRKADDDLPGLENLEKCDVALLYTRRLKITGEQLERVKKYCQSGKPLVALRTASHAFQNWLDLDKEVLGGNYKNHYGEGLPCAIALVDTAKQHPILKGFTPFKSAGSLYKNTGIAKDTELLLTGSIPDHTEPLAWTRLHKGGRIFYTSLGHPRDFEEQTFVRMVVHALYWTAQRPLPE